MTKRPTPLNVNQLNMPDISKRLKQMDDFQTRLNQIEDFQKKLQQFAHLNPLFESITLTGKGDARHGVKITGSKDGVFIAPLPGSTCAIIVSSKNGSHTIRVDGEGARIEVRDASGKPSISIDGTSGDVLLP
jgi:hypothetical protein